MCSDGKILSPPHLVKIAELPDPKTKNVMVLLEEASEELEDTHLRLQTAKVPRTMKQTKHISR
jgi:hypothetical protein